MKVLEESEVGKRLKASACGTGEHDRNDGASRKLFNSPVNTDLYVVFRSLQEGPGMFLLSSFGITLNHVDWIATKSLEIAIRLKLFSDPWTTDL
jgi:hypothetical protein